jgi:hypothetical protein
MAITAITDRLAVTVDDLKLFLRIEHADEDAQLENFLAAAMLQADHFCQNTFTTVNEAGAEVLLDIPADIKIAVLRIAAALYESRADHIAGSNIAGLSIAAGQIEWNAQRLLQPYRKFFAV